MDFNSLDNSIIATCENNRFFIGYLDISYRSIMKFGMKLLSFPSDEDKSIIKANSVSLLVHTFDGTDSALVRERDLDSMKFLDVLWIHSNFFLYLPFGLPFEDIFDF